MRLIGRNHREARLSDEGGATPNPDSTCSPDGDAWAQRVSAGVARGDRAALGEFYRAWFDRSLGLARRATGRDEAFCLDVVQDAMVKAAASLRRVETGAQLGAWMKRVIVSSAIDRVREESARAARQRRVSGPELGAASEPAVERLAWLEAELRKVSEEEMVLLRVRIVNNGTMERAGGLIGVNGAAAHGRVRRLIEGLRRAGKARFGDA